MVEICSGIGVSSINLKWKIRPILAVELDPQRCEIYKQLHQHEYSLKILNGDISDPITKAEVIHSINTKHISIAVISTPCTGFSLLGKNKNNEDYLIDRRNYLTFHVLSIIEACSTELNYILIENVIPYATAKFPWNGQFLTITDILKIKFQNTYHIDCQIIDMSLYNVRSSRKRTIIRLWKKGLSWELPHPKKPISLLESIDFLPPIEANQESPIYPLHKAPRLSENIINSLRHTPSGCCAFDNPPEFQPKRADGTLIKAFRSTYCRSSPDKPASTITSGHRGSNCYHYGRLLENGEYSDARNFTILELLIISGIINPDDIKDPNNIPPKARNIIEIFGMHSEVFMRKAIADGIPASFLPTIFKKI